MKNFKKLFFILNFILVFIFSQTLYGENKNLVTGSKTGTAEGYHGKITVLTELKDGKFTNISIKSHTETKGVGDTAISKIPNEIVKKQSLDVDSVAGATITSKAIVTAVANGLEKLGVDPVKYAYKADVSKNNNLNTKLDLKKLPKKKAVKETIIITDARGRKVEIGLPISTYAISTMDVIDYIIPLKGKEAFNMLVGSGQDGGHGLNKYAKLYTPIVGNYMEHTAQISEHASPFDLEMLLAVQPDVLIVNSAMAAHKYSLEIEEQLAEAGIKIILIDVPGKDPEKSVQQTMKILGDLFQEKEKANEVINFIDKQYSLITKNLKNIKYKPTVYYEKSGYSEVFGPTATSKSGWGIIINIAGGKNIADEILGDKPVSKGGGNTTDPEFVLKNNPDFIILSGVNDGWLDSSKEKKNCKFDIVNRNGWKDLKAVKNKNLYEFAHSTSRSIYGFYPSLKMATIFYPEEFKGVNPEAILDEFFDKFMILDSSITTWMFKLEDCDKNKTKKK
ncbi:MAG: ABC transporter substrate-binding protein [Fusobacterium sp.]|uniref:ABC transporter substrate-binding protein n=1 Tax=Fusobacterium sp. TaxID=68766 RepID=UPI003F9ECED2